MSGSSDAPEWYRDWFGEEYLALYPHRDAEEARAAVELLLKALGRPRGWILDLACGAGRHMDELAERGLAVVGLDLSRTLLREARSRSQHHLLVQGDMRHLPFRDGSFEVVANFFTSFGYFAGPEEDSAVLAEIRRVLRPGGGFMLDFLNAQRVRGSLVPRDERSVNDRRVVQERRLEEDGSVVVKQISVFDPETDKPPRTYFERVRLYGPVELETMLRAAGLESQTTFGDYSGAGACADCPRYILAGRAV